MYDDSYKRTMNAYHHASHRFEGKKSNLVEDVHPVGIPWTRNMF